MKTEEFVTAIKQVVVDASIESVEANLINPPGRSPSKHLIEMSEWFNRLHNQDKNILHNLIKEAVETSVFGFLCVLDGVRAFENGEEKGELKLFYENKEENVLLNNVTVEYMHDIFNSL